MKDKVIKIVVYAFLVLLSLAFLFPLYLMVEMSLFTSNDVFEIPRRLFPSALTFSNYVECFTIAGYVPDEWGNPTSMPYMVVYLLNSIYVVVGNVAGTVLSSTLCSYGFAKIKFKFREPIFFAVLATMMIPGSVTMLSMFTVYKNLGMMNTRLPLWLPVWFGGGAVNIFLLRQFMRGLPNDILESASIDGAGHLRKLFQIVVPNCVPILIYIAMQSAMGTWNDFFTPLLYVNEKEKWTLALGVASIIQTNDSGLVTTKHLLMAACTIMTVFPLGLFIGGQKYFIENVAITGVKG